MISLIVPTLGERIYELKRLINSLEKQTNKEFELILVSQANHKIIEAILDNSKLKYRHITINKKGLSLARNIGLDYVKGDILTFSDDDCWYPEDAFDEVEKMFKNTNSNILCFNIFDPISKQIYKNYKKSNKNNLSDLDIFRVSSIEIFINLETVCKNHIKFDERFGLGAKFNSGEENILLVELKRKNYIIGYIYKTIVYHKIKKKNIKFDSGKAYSKGAMFKCMYPNIKGLIYANLLVLKNLKRIEHKVECLINVNKGFLKFSKY